MHVYEQGTGTIDDNDIFANQYSGLEIDAGGNPTIRRNNIHDGKAAGVYVHTDGLGTLEENESLATRERGSRWSPVGIRRCGATGSQETSFKAFGSRTAAEACSSGTTSATT